MKINTEKLNKVLARNGMNLNDAAEACGVSRMQFYKYRHRNIKPVTVNKIADSLGCEVSDLV